MCATVYNVAVGFEKGKAIALKNHEFLARYIRWVVAVSIIKTTVSLQNNGVVIVGQLHSYSD